LKLDYNKIRLGLSGTPLGSLTDKQLKDAIIGEYPLLYSDKMLKRLWHKVCGLQEIEISRIKAIEIESILSGLETRSLEKRRFDIADSLKAIRLHLNTLHNQVSISKAQAEIILNQESELLRYEIETRDLKNQIERLKEGM